MNESEKQIAGNEPDDATAFAGDELDDATPFAGDELNDSSVLAGETPGDSAAAESKKKSDSNSMEEASDILVETAPGRKKVVVLSLLAGLCVLAVGSFIGWNIFSPDPEKANTVVRMAIVPEQPVAFEAFVIPYNRNDHHYLSFSVSISMADNTVLHELKQNREIFRGKIYDLLKAYTAQHAVLPSPTTIKEVVENSVNTGLSKGRAGRVLITQFIII